MKLKRYLTIMLILSTMCMTGCWDKVEIDEKAFVSILGVDAGKDISKEEHLNRVSQGASFTGNKFDKIRVTYSFPNISELGPQKGGTAGESSMSVDAYSMQDSLDKVLNKSSRFISFGHLKLIVLSSSLLDSSITFKEVIDYLQRQPAVNRMTYIVFSDNKSEEILNFKPNMEKSIENYIVGILENNTQNNTAFPLTLNEFLESTSESNSALVPVINIDKKNRNFKIAKVAVINNNKIKGYITTEQANSIQLIGDKKFKGGNRTIIRDGSPLDYSIDDSSRKITLTNKKNLTFHIKLDIEGEIKGYNIDKQISSKGDINKIEEDLNKAIVQEINEAIRISQSDYNTDILHLGEYIHKYHPALWKEIKGNWDDLYKTVNINITADTKVRRIGSIK